MYFNYNGTDKCVELAVAKTQKTLILQLEDWQVSYKHHNNRGGILWNDVAEFDWKSV